MGIRSVVFRDPDGTSLTSSLAPPLSGHGCHRRLVGWWGVQKRMASINLHSDGSEGRQESCYRPYQRCCCEAEQGGVDGASLTLVAVWVQVSEPSGAIR